MNINMLMQQAQRMQTDLEGTVNTAHDGLAPPAPPAGAGA